MHKIDIYLYENDVKNVGGKSMECLRQNMMIQGPSTSVPPNQGFVGWSYSLSGQSLVQQKIG